jgi:light-harvesting complex I chlorophyll a/b binding protein 5
MAVAFKSTIASKALAGSRSAPVRPAKAARSSVRVRAEAATRPTWYPGNPIPAHLDTPAAKDLAGNYGFDPLYLAAKDEEGLRWMVHAELQNGRWAMLGAAGVLLTSIGAACGLPFPQWYEAGKQVDIGNWSFGTLLFTQAILFHWVETKRGMDIRNPGSQGDGSFFGITDDFKPKETLGPYPGGRLFDPIGFSRGDAAQYKKYKQNEITNARLAMVANLGFWAQYAATGKGPIQNLQDHLADPYHVTFATNGVSVPFLSQ